MRVSTKQGAAALMVSGWFGRLAEVQTSFGEASAVNCPDDSGIYREAKHTLSAPATGADLHSAPAANFHLA